MKVCTDACLFGSLLPVLKKENGKIQALDIGTGTGLLALMYAQKNPLSLVDAVEIDEAAAQQAKENFELSPWKERLNIYHASVQEFSKTREFSYDLIFSNPPFFENDLKSDDDKRNLALHSAELSLEELVFIVTKLLKEEGVFAVLLPYHRTTYFEELAQNNNLFLRQKILIKQTPKHNYFRSILHFNKYKSEVKEFEIVIQTNEGKYTEEFIALLKDYYLYL